MGRSFGCWAKHDALGGGACARRPPPQTPPTADALVVGGTTAEPTLQFCRVLRDGSVFACFVPLLPLVPVVRVRCEAPQAVGNEEEQNNNVNGNAPLSSYGLTNSGIVFREEDVAATAPRPQNLQDNQGQSFCGNIVDYRASYVLWLE
ncbi:hypothetical protein AAG570_001146 [Ranatra chinensis]|uniref:Uncharacterized protein n=1 Tax=Ranatra chinensis TaxID=642074 RepID=A0ABD0YB15_9HEMI